MKIYIASHGSELAGAELSLVEIAAKFASDGHEGVVTVPSNGDLLERLLARQSSFAPVIVRSRRWMGKRFGLVVGLIRLFQSVLDSIHHVRLMYKYRPDVVLVNSAVIPAPLLAAFVAKIPAVTFVRESVRTNPSLRTVMPRGVICWFVNRFSAEVVCNSNYIADQYGYGCAVIYPPLGDEYRTPSRKLIGTPRGDGLSIAMVGTLGVEKGQIDFLAACEVLLRHGVSFNARIFGGGSPAEIDILMNGISRLGLESVVRYCGPSRRPSEVYRAADVTVVCARNEAFGKVTIESIACGTPVVGYRLGGTAEILTAGGGIMVSPDPVSLAAALLRVATDDALLADLLLSCAKHPLIDECKRSVAKASALIEAVSPTRREL